MGKTDARGPLKLWFATPAAATCQARTAVTMIPGPERGAVAMQHAQALGRVSGRHVTSRQGGTHRRDMTMSQDGSNTGDGDIEAFDAATDPVTIRRRRRRQTVGVAVVGLVLAGAFVGVRATLPAATPPAGPTLSPTTAVPAPAEQPARLTLAPVPATPDPSEEPPAVPPG